MKKASDISLADSLKLGSLPRNHPKVPSDAYRLIEFASKNEIGKILEYKPNNWPQEWIDWFEILKIECLLALGDDKKATSKLENFKSGFSSDFVRLKQLMSIGKLDEASELAGELITLDTKSVHLALSFGEIEEASGNLDLAYIHYKSANTLAKHWNLPMLKLASVSMTRGKYDEASYCLKED